MTLKQNIIITVLLKNQLSLPAKTQKVADRNYMYLVFRHYYHFQVSCALLLSSRGSDACISVDIMK